MLLCTSDGRALSDINGLSFGSVMDWLFGLRYTNSGDARNVFVCYAFSRDNEFIFSSLPNDVKDKLFQAHRIRGQIDRIEYEQEKLENDLYHVAPDSYEHLELELFRGINKLALRELVEVKYKGFEIQLRNGKSLIIRKGKKQFTMYDVYGFFRKPLRDAYKEWLDDDIALLDRAERKLIDGLNVVEQLNQFAQIEARGVQALTTYLDTELQALGISLTRFHGAGALSSWMLSNAKAKTKNKETNQYHNYRYERQLGKDCFRAMLQSYYGGRAEQFKIGSFNEGVNVYDINSAYAHAVTFLPYMLHKPRYADAWLSEPFSVWYCEYDFSSVNPYFGYLPNREKRSNQTTYKVRGRGFFWQAEVAYILEHFPQCIEVGRGYYVPYERAPFADKIAEFYEWRKLLQQAKHPLDKVFKIALSSIYGKFCEGNGKGYYYNMFYAGFITSATRRKLLESTRGNEHNIICFLTDAIHSTVPLSLPVSNELGEYKHEVYERATYLDNGVYRLTRDGKEKTATRGFREFDFDGALNQFQEHFNYDGVSEFFIGHNLHSFAPIMYYDYLKLQGNTKRNEPLRTSARKFDGERIDISQTFIDSQLYRIASDLESGLYKRSWYKETDLARDTMDAKRI